MKKQLPSDLQRLSVEAFRAADKVPLVLVLEDVRSALNVGSIFRTADAFALEGLRLCGISARPPHREIHKTALGSTASVAWAYDPDVVAVLQQLRSEGYRIFALEQVQPSTLLHRFSPEPSLRYALVLGNEVAGVSETALAHCDGALEIPQFGTKHSLNIAVAAGIAAWEFARKSALLRE